jgi:hypothetical protein
MNRNSLKKLVLTTACLAPIIGLFSNIYFYECPVHTGSFRGGHPRPESFEEMVNTYDTFSKHKKSNAMFLPGYFIFNGDLPKAVNLYFLEFPSEQR